MPIGTDVFFPAIQAALAAGEFRDIASVAALPGMPRAVLQSLDATWRADIDLGSFPKNISRLADLDLIEARIDEAFRQEECFHATFVTPRWRVLRKPRHS